MRAAPLVGSGPPVPLATASVFRLTGDYSLAKRTFLTEVVAVEASVAASERNAASVGESVEGIPAADAEGLAAGM